MKKRLFFSAIILFLALAVSAINGYRATLLETPSPEPLILNDGGDHDAVWAQIDTLIYKGRRSKVLPLVDSLYPIVKRENNLNQMIKCAIYRIKCLSVISPNNLSLAQAWLKKEIEEVPSPVKELFLSARAEVYRMYLYWVFPWLKAEQNSDAANPALMDLDEWTPKAINKKIASLYEASMTNKATQGYTLKDYVGAFKFNDMLETTPQASLYDFLAWRALDYMEDTRNDYMGYEWYAAGESKDVLFAPAETFLMYKPKSSYVEEDDYMEGDYTIRAEKAVNIFQDLTRLHLRDTNQAMLQDIELHRIKFMAKYLHADTSFCVQVLKREMKRWRLQPIYTEWAYMLAEHYYNSAYLYNSEKSDAHYWDFKIADEILSKAICRYPKSYGAKQCQNLRTVMYQPQLNVECEKVYPINKPMLMLMNYQNTLIVYYRLVYLEENQYDYAMNSRYYEKQTLLEKASAIAKLPILKSWAIIPKHDGAFREHHAEIKVDAQKKAGRYILLSSTRADFNADKGIVTYAPFYVTDMAYVGNCKNSDWYVFNRTSGKPISDVKALYYSMNTSQDARLPFRSRIYPLDSIYSNGNGLLDYKLAYSIWNGEIRFSKGKDYFNSRYSVSNSYHCNYDSKRFITHVYTDRAIYRPGQTIYFKGLAVSNDLYEHNPQGLPFLPRTIIIRDVNNKEIYRKVLTTNAYGTFSDSFVLPAGGLSGQFHIYDITNNPYDRPSKSFRVEEYKRPKFEVTLVPSKTAYRLNDSILVTGKALAFAGNSIDNAQISAWAIRSYTAEQVYRNYKYNVELGRDYIANQALKTKPNGDIEFKFKAIPPKNVVNGRVLYYNYHVTVQVIDVTGEVHEVYQDIKVGEPSLRFEIDLPEYVSKTDLKAIKVSSLNLNNGFEPAQGTLKIERLLEPSKPFIDRLWEGKYIDQYTMTEAEFKADFPNMTYRNENDKTTWRTQELAFTANFDTKQSDVISLSKANTLSAGTYKVTLSGKDKYANPVTLVKYMAVFDYEQQKMPANNPLILHTDKVTYEPNEVATLSIGSSFDDCWVLYKIVHDDEILAEHWLNVKGINQIQIPILESYRGGCVVSAVMMKNNRLYSQKAALKVPFTNKELKIEYMTFRDKLQPGQDEEWRIKISGPKGEKVAAELLADLYDASLDAFLPNKWNSAIYNNNPADDEWLKLYGVNETEESHLIIYPYIPFLNKNTRIYPSLNWYSISDDFKALHRHWGNGFTTFTDETGLAYYHSPFMYSSWHYTEIPGYKNLNRNRDKAVSLNQASGLLVLSPEQIAKRGRRDISQIGASAAKLSQEDRGTEGSIPEESEAPEAPKDLGNIPVRSNLNELVFFKPDLMTDTEGNVIIKFKMNEALTRWRLMLLAITKDLQVGYSERFITTQKDLMVVPNAPRFLREGDDIEFTAKVNNISAKALSGDVKLELYDALTMQPIDNLLGNQRPTIAFTAEAGQSTLVKWKLAVPDYGLSALTYRVIAQAGDFSDGEESSLPVVTNSMLVTETMPLPVRGGQTKAFEFKHMTEVQQSKTARANLLTLEFTANPTWYAVQSLSYLIEYQNECTEQLFARFYGNALASHIINSNPKIKSVFDKWRNEKSNALISKLLKNEELKSALIEETPWVLQTQNEAEQKRRLALLFDLDRMSRSLDETVDKITRRQRGDGSFTWFGGDVPDLYITQHIIEGFGHLDYMGVNVFENKPQVESMIRRAINYCDAGIIKYSRDTSYFRLSDAKHKWDWLSAHYLYARSFYIDPNNGHLFVPLEGEMKTLYDSWILKITKYWHLNTSCYRRGLWALAAHRYGNKDLAKEIMKSIKDEAIEDEEFGTHWFGANGYYWYEANIETHALLLEAFNEIAPDAKLIDGVKTYLIKHKQTHAWATTSATTAATYALLMVGDDWLAEDKDINITLGNTLLDQSKIQKEAGTGYFKTTWQPADIKPEMAKVKIENPNKNVAWGAMYWQYFEQLDKITSFKDTPLKLNKQLFRQDNTDKGPVLTLIDEKTELHVGDLVKVRIELSVDRDMEYVQLKDMRASCFEPTNVLSGYSYQGGLGHYETTRDLSTSFFIGYLSKGSYVFEYPLRVTHRGDFSNGITTIQCMYAPEFTSHSEGIRVQVK